MPKVRCNYTNCIWNDAPNGSSTGKCIKEEIELTVWYTNDDEEHHECKSYEYADKGSEFRRS